MSHRMPGRKYLSSFRLFTGIPNNCSFHKMSHPLHSGTSVYFPEAIFSLNSINPCPFHILSRDSLRTSPSGISPARSTQHGTTVPSHFIDMEYQRNVQGTYLRPTLRNFLSPFCEIFPPNVCGAIRESLSIGRPSSPFRKAFRFSLSSRLNSITRNTTYGL